jgi:hypothetical protein
MAYSNTTTFSDTATKKTTDLRFRKKAKPQSSEEVFRVTYDAILHAKTKLQEEIIHLFIE